MRPPAVPPDTAGIDIGATAIYVAVPPNRDPEPVRSFETFTPGLRALADWLQARGIRTVAIESTGVFWVPLFEILKEPGLKVCLVRARHLKNVPGRKIRRPGLPVVAVPAFGGTAAGFVPASAGNVCPAGPPSPSRQAGADEQPTRSAHPEGAEPDEFAVAPRHSRYHPL